MARALSGLRAKTRCWSYRYSNWWCQRRPGKDSPCQGWWWTQRIEWRKPHSTVEFWCGSESTGLFATSKMSSGTSSNGVRLYIRVSCSTRMTTRVWINTHLVPFSLLTNLCLPGWQLQIQPIPGWHARVIKCRSLVHSSLPRPRTVAVAGVDKDSLGFSDLWMSAVTFLYSRH